MYIYLYTHTYICVHVLYMFKYIYMYTCIYGYICIYINMYKRYIYICRKELQGAIHNGKLL